RWLGQGDLTGLWEVCPAWAATLAMSHAELATRQYLEPQLGADPVRVLSCVFYPHMKEIQPFLAMDHGQVDEIRERANLIPRRVLDVESQSDIQLEWLLAHKRRVFSASSWAAANISLADELPQVSTAIRQRFESIRPVRSIVQAHREADF